jgi:hypothetical protein
MARENKSDKEKALVSQLQDGSNTAEMDIARKKKLGDDIMNRSDQQQTYTVITGRYPHHVEEDVKLCIEAGYEPLGGMVVEYGEVTIYHQTVYLPPATRAQSAEG